MPSAIPIPQFPQSARLVTPINDSGASSPNALWGSNFSNMLYVGGTGTVTVMFGDDSQLTFTAVAAGRWHHMPGFKHVSQTGTAATTVIIGIAYG